MKPTTDQICGALEHVRYEIESFLQTPEYDHSNKALEESVEFRKMAHCRVLHEFLTMQAQKRDSDTRYGDNIVSEDYGFTAKEVYPKDRRALLDRFNKDLFHLTYERLKRTPQTKPWPRHLLFPPVAQRAREFIEHILTNSRLSVKEGELALWKKLKAALEADLPLQQNTSNTAATGVVLTSISTTHDR
jgi:hypothetical protein